MIRVALLETALPERKSGVEYAARVGRAFAEEPRRVHLDRVDLALTDSSGWVPARFRVWANHAHIVYAARRLRRARADVFHVADGSFAYLQRALGGRPVVVTAHDVIPFLNLRGRFGAPSGSALARFTIGRALDGLRAADRVVAVSAHTRRDLVEAGGLDPQRVDVVPFPLSAKAERALALPPVDWVERRDSAPVVLHVGHGGFYKNREGVVRIFERVAAASDARLVLAGAPPSDALRGAVEAAGLSGRVQFEVSPDEERLTALYRRASLLLFPSLYEGFGIPTLEAMAAGTPVVCSSAASLPEVVGDAALTAPPEAEDELARLCLRVLDDDALALDLIARGRRRAPTFDLAHMADRLLGVYERVAR